MSLPFDDGFSVPAEWALHARCWMAWPTRAESWGEHLDAARDSVAELANTVAEFEPVSMITKPKNVAEVSLATGTGVSQVSLAHDDCWMRDIGPSFVANAGGDTINSNKQAAEFGIVKGGQKLAGLLVFVSDEHSLGLERAQGLNLTEAFYWDLNDKTRAFSKRFAAKHNGKMPTSVQAGFYSGALQYLNAVKAANTDNSDAVMAKLKEIKWDDPVFGQSYIRADGRKMHDMYLFEVKKPSESKGPWDYYKVISKMSAEEAFRPMDQGECPLIKKN